MSKDFYLDWTPADWIKDTRGLSPSTKGIWFDCLNFMFIDNFYQISGSIDSLARKTGSTIDEFRKALVELKIEKVCEVTQDNDLITLESRRFKRIYKSNEGNNLRQKRFKEKHKNNDEITDEKQKSVNTNSNSLFLSSESSSEFEIKKGMQGETKKQYPKDFEAFWLAYPRRVGKGAALKSWIQAIKIAEAIEIIKGVEKYKAILRDKCTEEKYIAHPSTWLNQRRWEDAAGLDLQPKGRPDL